MVTGSKEMAGATETDSGKERQVLVSDYEVLVLEGQCDEL